LINEKIERGLTLKDIQNNDYLKRWFTPERIEDLYNQAMRERKRRSDKQDKLLRCQIKVRMTRKQLVLLQKAGRNLSEAIRFAIDNTYGGQENGV
jgi:hypothetical protein